jgi:hypothetical protein
MWTGAQSRLLLPVRLLLGAELQVADEPAVLGQLTHGLYSFVLNGVPSRMLPSGGAATELW